MAARPLRENLTLLLSIAAHVLKETQQQRLAELDLGVREHIVLNAIAEGAPTQLAIADKAGLDKSTLIPVLDRLERQKMIERHPDPKDRRARIVTMSDLGRRTLARSGRTASDVEKDLLADLTSAERTQLRSLLQRIVEGRISGLSVPGSCL